jgi:hypothetical protein
MLFVAERRGESNLAPVSIAAFFYGSIEVASQLAP